MPQEQTNKNNEAGFISIEVMGALLVLSIILAIMYSLWETQLAEMRKRAVAKHFEMVNIAAEKYAEENRTDLLNNAGTTSGKMITIQDLKDSDFLPDGFNTKNIWGQTYQIFSRKPSAGKLQIIILTTGGKKHDEDEPKFGNVIVPSTAAIVTVGFIPVESPNTLRGAYNAWDINLENVGIRNTESAPQLLAAGHLGNLITVSASGTGGGSGGNGGGDGGTTPELDLTGNPEYVQFGHTPWKELEAKCQTKEDIGKVFFTNNFVDQDPTKQHADFLDGYNGLFVCMRYWGGKLYLMRLTQGNQAQFNRDPGYDLADPFYPNPFYPEPD